MPHSQSARPGGRYTPASVHMWREGYGLAFLRADLMAGVTVAVVALPLSMAIAIASGVPPERGLITAIVGGFVVSALGGSRYQVGGPAGAFIVLVALCVARHGLDGLVTATALSGLMLTALGLMRLGALVRLVPHPVTLGFTAGIGGLILASQIRPLFGLTLAAPEPGPMLEKLPVLWAAMPGLDLTALALGLGAIACVLGLRRARPRWPGMLIAVALAAILTVVAGLGVETIASRFGGLPPGLPVPSLPNLALVWAVLPEAGAFALLGAIESLLSATVADTMTGRRHNPDAELIAQGLANVATACFGGFCVTGTIARTATNVRAGATGPVAGMAHAGVLALFVLVAAPLADPIPLAALAGVLVVVGFGMVEWHGMRRLRAAPGELLVLAVTLVLTLVADLMLAIGAGIALAGALHLARGGRGGRLVVPDTPGSPARLVGSCYFGNAARIESALAALPPGPIVLDLGDATVLDATGVEVLKAIARTHPGGLRLTGTPQPLRPLLQPTGLL